MAYVALAFLTFAVSIGFLWAEAVEDEMHDLASISLARHPHARCLHGEPATLLYLKANTSNNWIIALVGDRTSLDSSKGDDLPEEPRLPRLPEFLDNTASHKAYNLISSFESGTLPMRSFNYVLLPYCSIGLWTGFCGSSSPSTSRFCGANIVKAALEELLESYSLRDARDVLLYGFGAGALGIMAHARMVQQALPGSSLRIMLESPAVRTAVSMGDIGSEQVQDSSSAMMAMAWNSTMASFCIVGLPSHLHQRCLDALASVQQADMPVLDLSGRQAMASHLHNDRVHGSVATAHAGATESARGRRLHSQPSPEPSAPGLQGPRPGPLSSPRPAPGSADAATTLSSGPLTDPDVVALSLAAAVLLAVALPGWAAVAWAALYWRRVRRQLASMRLFTSTLAHRGVRTQRGSPPGSLALAGVSAWHGRPSDKPVRQVLFDVTAAFLPGVTCIMGDEGAGVPELMRLAALRYTAGEIRGDVSFNGQVVQATREWRRRVGHVGHVSEDELPEGLSVLEALMLRAACVTPPAGRGGASLEATLRRVHALMQQVGVSPFSSKRIPGLRPLLPSPSSCTAFISPFSSLSTSFSSVALAFGSSNVVTGSDASTGPLTVAQRARVRLAWALVGNPCGLVVEEVADGLAGREAAELLRAAGCVAGSDRLPVLVSAAAVPLPPDAFLELDNVLLLGAGQMLYYGRAEKALPYMRHLWSMGALPLPPRLPLLPTPTEALLLAVARPDALAAAARACERLLAAPHARLVLALLRGTDLEPLLQAGAVAGADDCTHDTAARSRDQGQPGACSGTAGSAAGGSRANDAPADAEALRPEMLLLDVESGITPRGRDEQRGGANGEEGSCCSRLCALFCCSRNRHGGAGWQGELHASLSEQVTRGLHHPRRLLAVLLLCAAGGVVGGLPMSSALRAGGMAGAEASQAALFFLLCCAVAPPALVHFPALKGATAAVQRCALQGSILRSFLVPHLLMSASSSLLTTAAAFATLYPLAAMPAAAGPVLSALLAAQLAGLAAGAASLAAASAWGRSVGRAALALYLLFCVVFSGALLPAGALLPGLQWARWGSLFWQGLQAGLAGLSGQVVVDEEVWQGRPPFWQSVAAQLLTWLTFTLAAATALLLRVRLAPQPWRARVPARRRRHAAHAHVQQLPEGASAVAALVQRGAAVGGGGDAARLLNQHVLAGETLLACPWLEEQDSNAAKALHTDFGQASVEQWVQLSATRSATLATRRVPHLCTELRAWQAPQASASSTIPTASPIATLSPAPSLPDGIALYPVISAAAAAPALPAPPTPCTPAATALGAAAEASPAAHVTAAAATDAPAAAAWPPPSPSADGINSAGASSFPPAGHSLALPRQAGGERWDWAWGGTGTGVRRGASGRSVLDPQRGGPSPWPEWGSREW